MPKLITFITTETDGFHTDKPFEITMKKNLYKYAHMVKLVYHQGYYENGEITTNLKKSFLIKPENFIFPDELKKINGLTHKKLVKKGCDLESVIKEFVEDLKKSSVIVGHSLPFHLKTIQASFFRSGINDSLNKYDLIDIINYNHTVDKPNLLNLSKEILNIDYESKPRSYQISIIKKVFGKLYQNTENYHTGE